jgi:ribosomal protein S18 acetylase RimI-like enzyme
MEEKDIASVALIHASEFGRQRHSEQWISSTLKAYPRSLCYVIEINHEVVGYITWLQKNGFRPEAVVELDQVAVKKELQGNGVGKQLILESIKDVRFQLQRLGLELKHILVSTRSDNAAQQLYKSAFGAQVEVTISNLYSSDEVFMVVRNV